MPVTENETNIDYDKGYDALLTEWKAFLNDQNDTFYFNSSYASRKTYYALYDIDGNGIMELLFTNGNGHEDIIAYIFTIKDGEPINLFGYDDKGRPHQAPMSRIGSSKILDNGLIDCNDGDGTIYKIAEDGYSLIEYYAQAYDYPDESSRAEAKWMYYINEVEVDYDFYYQYLKEQGYVNGNNTLANIDWISIE